MFSGSHTACPRCCPKSASPLQHGQHLRPGGSSSGQHTDSDRIEYGRLTQEQIDSLTEHHRLGAAAFIMVSFGLQDFYRVPWEVWRDMKSIYGRKHIKQPELEPCRVQYIAGVLKLLEGAASRFSKCSPARLLWSPRWLRWTLERAVVAVGSG